MTRSYIGLESEIGWRSGEVVDRWTSRPRWRWDRVGRAAAPLRNERHKVTIVCTPPSCEMTDGIKVFFTSSYVTFLFPDPLDKRHPIPAPQSAPAPSALSTWGASASRRP